MIAVTYPSAAGQTGSNYNVPEPGDVNTQSLTDFLVQLAAQGLALPVSADLDLAAAFGIKAIYFKTRTANPAAAGILRLAITDTISWRNNVNAADDTLAVNTNDVLTFRGVPAAHVFVTVSYGASMTIDASAGDFHQIAVTNGTAFTLNAPANPVAGAQVTLRIKNTSGGAMGVITWNAAFKMSAWTNPASANSRSITFVYDGTNWVQMAQTGVDVPN